MTILTKVLVGSRLHQLHNEQSDYDWRTIHIDPKAVLSPFRPAHDNTPEQEEWEIRDFCKYLTKGHPRVMEVLFSNIVEVDSEPMAIMRQNWRKFVDSEAYVTASLKYAGQQYKKFTAINDHRTPKFLIASILTLWRADQFTKTGRFPLRVENEAIQSSLLQAKQRDIDMMYSDSLYAALYSGVASAHLTENTNYKPDINFIEDFLYDTYLHHQ